MQKINKKYTAYLSIIFLLLFYIPAIAQVDCEADKNYSLSNVTINTGTVNQIGNDDNSIQLTIGSPMIGQSGSYNQGNSAVYGFWSFYNLQPESPILKASEGEYIDRIALEWEIVDDINNAPVTEVITKIYRNGTLLTTVPVGQTSYLDFNVFPGEFYNYEIVTTNDLGDSKGATKVGFLNPNGRVTGKVESRNGVPVDDVKITLLPNLGKTLFMDGEDDYVYFDGKTFNFNKVYTIEGWFRNVDVKNQTIFSVLDSGTTTPIIKLSLDEEGKFTYYHDPDADGTGVSLTTQDGYNLTADTREWHHFAAVHEDEIMYLYINGLRVGTLDDTASDITPNAQVEFGKDGVKIFSGYFSGYIDDFRIWDIAKTRQEIRKFADITLTGEEDNLMAYWKFDEQFGEKIYDFAAKDNVADRLHAITCEAERRDNLFPPVQLGAYTDSGGDYIVKGVYYGSGTTFSVSSSKETAIGVSMKFDGTDDYISFQNDRLPMKDAFTLEGWFKTDAQAEMTIFETTDPNSDEVLLNLGMNSSGNIVFTSGLSGSEQSITSSTAYNNEFWYHYAITHDGSDMKLYIDGEEKGTLSETATFDLITRFVIGRTDPNKGNSGSNFYNGRLDEMRFWNYARSANQISGTMEQVLPVDELGVVTTEGVEANWTFNEGLGEIVSDISAFTHTGNLLNPQTETVNGETIVTNWDGDDIALDVEFFSHTFEPNERNVTLDLSNVSVDRVDFTDISQLTVSGFVRFLGTDCFTDSVELFVNGTSTLPKTYTDKDGKFKLEFEPGTTNAIVTYNKEDHTFAPGFIELPKLVRPLAGLRIDNTTTRDLSGIVAGGACEFPIGTAKVIITTSPFCYTDTVEVDDTGAYEFKNIPPQNYIVFVEHDNPTIQSYFDLQGAAEVSLIIEDQTVDFIYKAPIQTEITGLTPNDCDKIIIKQNRTADLVFEVFEDYFGERCYIQSGIITVIDDIGDAEEAVEIEINSGFGYYTTKAGAPNILSGGEFPFQKKIQIVAEDTEGRQANDVAYAYVSGKKPRSVDFATKTPEIPYLILRKPPGDQSISYLTEGATYSNSMSFSIASDFEQGVFAELSLGQKLTTNAGTPFFSTEVEVDTEKSYSADISYGQHLETSTELTQEFTTSETISTTPGQGDLYVGGAMNILYGITDVLSIDENTCEVSISEDLLVAPDGFATTFVYSEDFIIEFVIPELVTIGDTVSANNWKQIIMMNELLKNRAEFEENISFDGGATINREKTTTVVSNFSLETEFYIDAGVAQSVGVEVNGAGLKGGNNTKLRMSMGGATTQTVTNTRTIGYTLSDGEFGDNFSVNIKNDPIYGTPVFETVSGASSCPYEGTVTQRANGLSAALEEQLIADVGSDLLGQHVEQLNEVLGAGEAVSGLLDDITGVINDLEIPGFEEVNVDNASDAIDAVIDEITGDENHGNTILDFYTATFDNPTVVEKNLKRQAIGLAVNQNIAIDVPENSQAVFLLSLGNLSETAEPGVYYLTALQESNPDGAIIKVNGQPLTGTTDIAVTLNHGEQIQATLTVEKGPTAFDYEDIEIMLYSACEKERAEFLGINIPAEPFASIEKISVHFIEVCSPITINDPGQNWVISSASDNKMTVSITDYNLEREEFEMVRFQYRKKIEGEPFVNAVELLKGDLDAVFHLLDWDVTNLDDGEYEIRAVTFCQGGIPSQISEVLTGTIDRAPPTLFGTQEPVDAVLGLDDEISITFNEDIICDNIISLAIPVSLVEGETNNIALNNSETGLAIEKIISCSGNKIIIVPDIQNKFIEGQVLRVDILGMEDQYGNQQTETLTWEFIIQRNPLEWIGVDVTDVIMEGETATFSRQIKNNGAFGVNFTMSGMLSIPDLNATELPNWVTASPFSGTIPPGGTELITFTISDQIDGGFYDETIVASSSVGAPELRLNLRVLCPTPSNWEIDASDYSYSMNFTSELIIDNEVSDDEYDLVAAFVGEEIRGIGNVSYVPSLDRHEVFLTVYSNVASGETIRFKVWDASTCSFYGGSEESYGFSANGIIGIPTSPVPITAAIELFQQVALSSGWNWFSVNLESEANNDINDFLISLNNPTPGDVLKNQSSFTQYVNSLGWVGTLNSLNINSMYQIKLSENDTLEMLGSPIDIETTDITIEAGWNWISYLPQSGLNVDEALSSLSPITGDLIKSQTTFAQYVENIGWVGNLIFMNPNEGYLLNVASGGVLNYPLVETNGREIKQEKRDIQLPENWKLNEHDYEQTMNLTAKIEGDFLQDGDWLGIYKDEVLRGVGEARFIESLNNYYFFSTIYSNKVKEENLSFVYFNKESGKTYNLNEKVVFASNVQNGNPLEPVYLTLPQDADILIDDEMGYDLYQNNPNPFTNETYIRYSLPNVSNVEIAVFNMLGQHVKTLVSSEQNKGRKAIKWNASDQNGNKVSKGIYFLRMRAGNYQSTIKMVVQR